MVTRRGKKLEDSASPSNYRYLPDLPDLPPSTYVSTTPPAALQLLARGIALHAPSSMTHTTRPRRGNVEPERPSNSGRWVGRSPREGTGCNIATQRRKFPRQPEASGFRSLASNRFLVARTVLSCTVLYLAYNATCSTVLSVYTYLHERSRGEYGIGWVGGGSPWVIDVVSPVLFVGGSLPLPLHFALGNRLFRASFVNLLARGAFWYGW